MGGIFRVSLAYNLACLNYWSIVVRDRENVRQCLYFFSFVSYFYYLINFILLLIPKFQNGKRKIKLRSWWSKFWKSKIWSIKKYTLLVNSFDANLNFYNINIKNVAIPCIVLENFHTFLNNSLSESFSVLHLNTRSMNKNFENFKNSLAGLKYDFGIICFSETWLNDLVAIKIMNYQIKNLEIVEMWLNGWVFVYELSGCGFESSCSQLYLI